MIMTEIMIAHRRTSYLCRLNNPPAVIWHRDCPCIPENDFYQVQRIPAISARRGRRNSEKRRYVTEKKNMLAVQYILVGAVHTRLWQKQVLHMTLARLALLTFAIRTSSALIRPFKAYIVYWLPRHNQAPIRLYETLIRSCQALVRLYHHRHKSPPKANYRALVDDTRAQPRVQRHENPGFTGRMTLALEINSTLLRGIVMYKRGTEDLTSSR
jgi:hypothetical protein